jgi:Pregnancy-associated plasma protein-A/Secretion system C-terminal sorting domain
MCKKVLKSIAILALLWPVFEAGAQEAKHFGKHSVYCGSSEYEAILQKKYPGRATTAGFEEWLAPKVQAVKNKRLQRSGNSTNQVLTIPVVVHIIHNGDAVGVNENISDEQVLSQITVLNQDYRRMSGTPGFNENPVGADTEVEFCLAQRDPNGLATTGITRHNYSQGDWTVADIDEIIKPQTQWDPNLYLNLWVVNEINMEFFGMMIPGIKGYATFPSASGLEGLEGEQDIANLGGVVIGHKFFGSPEVYAGGTYDNDQVRGRTASHEIGHFLGLRHIWGDGDCTMDDFCEDTPEAASATEGDCPSGQDTCPDSPGLDMVENYMDYSSEGCMNVFTQDQKDRIVAVLTNSPRRASLTTSQACSPATEHLNDGSLHIQDILLAGCSHTFTPGLKLFNAGTATLTSATITYNIDNGTSETYTWTGSLAHAEEAVITLPALSSTPGAHQFNAAITSVNGGTDEEAYNNIRSYGFTIAANINITELVIDVKQDFFGSETTWELTNSNGTVVASGGPYEDLMDPNAELPVHTSTVALESNQCYTFTIEDTGGNGIVGMLGEGYYQLKSGEGNIVGQGGYFSDSDSVSFGVNLILDTNSPYVLQGVTLYPVPSSDKITVVIPGNADVNTGDIYNNLGQLIQTVKVQGSTTVDITGLSDGVYYIKLSGGRQQKVLRFIKE